jgi:excisionase family DNA binding protein
MSRQVDATRELVTMPHSAGVPLTSFGEPRMAFSPDEAAELLGISPELVFDLLRTGQLKYRKAGRRTLISRVNLDDFLDGDTA